MLGLKETPIGPLLRVDQFSWFSDVSALVSPLAEAPVDGLGNQKLTYKYRPGKVQQFWSN